MIDIHAHILPGVDDGAPDMDCALGMAELAVEAGVQGIVATPHCGLPGQSVPQTLSWYWERLSMLRRELSRRALPLELYPGMEIFGTQQTARLLKEDRLLTLNRSRYPLIEFDFGADPEEVTWILDSVCALRLRPVIAHPERYRFVQRDPSLLRLWMQMGCLLQINRGSLLGRFGTGAERMAGELLERGYVTAVASDAHSHVRRTTWLRDAYEMIRRGYGSPVARALLLDNPERLLSDWVIDGPEPDWLDGEEWM